MNFQSKTFNGHMQRLRKRTNPCLSHAWIKTWLSICMESLLQENHVKSAHSNHRDNYFTAHPPAITGGPLPSQGCAIQKHTSLPPVRYWGIKITSSAFHVSTLALPSNFLLIGVAAALTKSCCSELSLRLVAMAVASCR